MSITPYPSGTYLQQEQQLCWDSVNQQMQEGDKRQEKIDANTKEIYNMS